MTRLLVSTSFSVLEIDLESLNIAIIHRGKGLYYGIALSDNGNLWVAARNKMVSSTGCCDCERGEILVFDRNYNLMETLNPNIPLRDMHQIEWNEGCLWVTCSRDNAVAIYDGITWERWHPLPEDLGAQRDIHHYNSLMFANGGVWLLAHNFGRSELLNFELPKRSLRARVPIGKIAHNIWYENGLLNTLSSGDGTVVDESGVTRMVGSFPRGYAQLADGRRVVGLNEYAERALRDKTKSEIGIFDCDWNRVSTIILQDEGMVLDIKIARP